MNTRDTIVALSSAAWPAARCVVRVSGEQAHALLCKLCGWDAQHLAKLKSQHSGKGVHQPVQLLLDTTGDEPLKVPAFVLMFWAPASYTGQDVAEFHVPGSKWVVSTLLDQLRGLGAKDAQPGEFTARAFFSGKLDLTRAEGVAAVIDAENTAQLDSARKLLSGELAGRVRTMTDELARLMSLVEAGIDFTDEDIRFITDSELLAGLENIHQQLSDLCGGEKGGLGTRHDELRVVMVGRANAGKSTLFNRLIGEERVVVSEVAGTTRDVIEGKLLLDDGLTVLLCDVAGIEEKATVLVDETQELIRQTMKERARRAIEQADVRVGIKEHGDTRPEVFDRTEIDLLVMTKADATGSAVGVLHQQQPNVVSVSAGQGRGLAELKSVLAALARQKQTAVGMALSQRQWGLMREAILALDRAMEAVRQSFGGEMVAVELNDALKRLGEVSGEVSNDDILGRVFSTFCIGK